MKEAAVIFEEISRIEENSKGKIVAIEIESGDYFIGDNVLEAYKKAIVKYPNRKFIFKRVGFDYTHFIGALE